MKSWGANVISHQSRYAQQPAQYQTCVECWINASLQGEEFYYCYPKQGSTACCSKVNKEDRLVKRKVCFILDSGNQAGREDICLKADSPAPQSGHMSFYRQREGATCRNHTVSSDSHLEIGHQWSNQSHLDCFSIQLIFSSRVGLSPFL